MKPGEGIRRDEYFIWSDEDPHANAHRVLGNDVSRRMIEYLVGRQPTKQDYARVYKRCLECHNTVSSPQPEELVGVSYFELNHEGVGCESCHGLSRDWVDEHYQPSWREKDDAEKAKFGMLATELLTDRAAVCARCHVGGGERDVDHDLIAAGHPQMKFEFSGYHTALPKHWNERNVDDDFELRLYEAGQIANMRARLTLLKERAARTTNDDGMRSVWPEFAEFDCFACHHSLGQDGGRLDRGFALSGKTGFAKSNIRDGRVSLPWGVWHFSTMPALAKDSPFHTKYKDLAAAMQRITAKSDAAVNHASEALAALEDEFLPGVIPQSRDAYLKKAEAEIDSGSVVETWDAAVQWYLLFAALDRGLPENPARREALAELKSMLKFGERFNSPVGFFGNGETANATEVREQLRKVLELLKR